MRIGFFGGTFDPVHFGHLLLAEFCREQAGLDRVLFVPCATSPYKLKRRATAGEHRAAMLRLATAGHSSFEVDTIELDRGGVSYTADTLAALDARWPEAELFFLMGADSLADLPRWHRPEEICRLAVPLAVVRAGSPEPDYAPLAHLVSPARLAYFRTFRVTMPTIDLSSTEIRRRLAAGQSIRYQTPDAVAGYLKEMMIDE